MSKKKDEFVDWAYGASKYPQTLIRSCNKKEFKLYPTQSMNGLSFSYSLGSIDRYSREQQWKDESAIWKSTSQIVSTLASIINPSITAKIDSNGMITLYVRGCKSPQLYTVKIFNQLNQLVSSISVGGRIDPVHNLGWIELKAGKEMPQKGYVEMEYNCDQEWLEKGFTMFSQLREYTQSHPFQLEQAKTSTNYAKQQVTQLPK